jgi:hypothetical protein
MGRCRARRGRGAARRTEYMAESPFWEWQIEHADWQSLLMPARLEAVRPCDEAGVSGQAGRWAETVTGPGVFLT